MAMAVMATLATKRRFLPPRTLLLFFVGCHPCLVHLSCHVSCDTSRNRSRPLPPQVKSRPDDVPVHPDSYMFRGRAHSGHVASGGSGDQWGRDQWGGGGGGGGGGGLRSISSVRSPQPRKGGPGVNTLVRHRFSAFERLKREERSDWSLPPKSVFSLSRKELALRAAQLEEFLQHLADTRAVERWV